MLLNPIKMPHLLYVVVAGVIFLGGHGSFISAQSLKPNPTPNTTPTPTPIQAPADTQLMPARVSGTIEKSGTRARMGGTINPFYAMGKYTFTANLSFKINEWPRPTDHTLKLEAVDPVIVDNIDNWTLRGVGPVNVYIDGSPNPVVGFVDVTLKMFPDGKANVDHRLTFKWGTGTMALNFSLNGWKLYSSLAPRS